MKDETTRRKTALIERCLPVDSAIDFGGMWRVDGFYARERRQGFEISRVTMVELAESENWKRDASLGAGIDFRKGDFSNERFMETITDDYDLALAYDVLLHQIDLRHTLSMMLSKTRRFFLVSQPVLREEAMAFRDCIVLLSGEHANSF